MKIQLKNFRCYESSTFDFGETGLSLLSGQSGTGKSTILMAIQYALTGEGRKIVMHGKTGCAVELEIAGLKIKRTSRPNRLIVNDEYEDDAAQEIINNKFGSAFESISYISQNARDSFINMSPTAKLEFLEKFALDGINVVELKGRCSSVKKTATLDLNSTSSKLSFARKMFSEMEEPEILDFPIKCRDREKATKNEEIRLKNSMILIKRSEKSIKEMEEKIKQSEIDKAYISNKESNLESYLSQLETSKRDLESIGYSEDEMNTITAKLKRIEEYTSQKEKMRKILQEVEDAKVKRNNLETAISDIPYTLEELEENIDITTDNIEMSKTKRKLLKQLEAYEDYDTLSIEYNKKSEELKQKSEELATIEMGMDVYTCPCCNNNLRIKDKKLVKIAGKVDPTLGKELTLVVSKLKTEISKLSIDMNAVKSINEQLTEYDEINLEEEASLLVDLEEFTKYKYKLEQYTKELSMLKPPKQVDDSVLLEYHDVKDINKAEIEKEYSECREKRVEYNTKSTYLTKLQESIKQTEKEINTRKETLGDVDQLQNDLDTKRTELSEHIKARDKASELLDKIGKWKEADKIREKWEKFKTEIQDLEEKEKNDTKRLAAVGVLQTKILEAESIAIANTINSINTHAQIYLDSFFPDNPITVRLKTFKETKTVSSKPQINLEIDYKGMECDINMLSGGELSRVTLAFTLALAEMFNVPMILLDECTSSLDQELTTSVIEGLKDNFNDKLVVLIAHQVVQGMFDKVIKL